MGLGEVSRQHDGFLLGLVGPFLRLAEPFQCLIKPFLCSIDPFLRCGDFLRSIHDLSLGLNNLPLGAAWTRNPSISAEEQHHLVGDINVTRWPKLNFRAAELCWNIGTNIKVRETGKVWDNSTVTRACHSNATMVMVIWQRNGALFYARPDACAPQLS